MVTPLHLQGPGGFYVSDDRNALDIDAIHAFLHTAYWSPGVPRDVVERAIASSVALGLYARDGTFAGLARAVTDKATFGYLADVFVLPAHRGRGLGSFLVQSLLDHPELQGLRRWLLATADAHGLYARLGFTALQDAGRYMERLRDPAKPYAS